MEKIGIDFFREFFHPHALTAEGERIWFLGGRADMEEDRYVTDLYRLEGGKVTRLTTSRDVSAYWRVEGRTLLRTTRDSKDKEAIKEGRPLTVLYRLPETGEAEEALRLEYSAGSFYFISPEKFLFTARFDPAYAAALEEKGSPEEALKALKEEKDVRVLTEAPFWSNGEGFIDSVRSRLYLYDHGRITPITGENFACETAAVSPDHSFALFIGEAYTDRMPLTNRIFRLELEDLTVTEMTPEGEGASYESVTFAGNDRAVVFYNRGDRRGMNQNSDIGLLELAGRKLTVLYDGGEFSAYSSVGSDVRIGGPAAPQRWVRGENYYFISTLEEHSCLMEGSLSGGSPRPFFRNPGMLCEAAPADNGFAAVVMEELGGEICRITPEGMTRLTELNTGLGERFETYPLAPLYFFNENGEEIHGFVIKPAGFDPAKKHPAILDIHGGPKTAYGVNFFHEMQYWAARGYAVFFCNPTGSDGRGEAFADIRGRYGETDYRDIMTFTDRVLEACPWIDREKVGVTGGSYGGFMTNWIIGHTDRFAAAVSQRGISNWISFYGTTDIGYYFGEDQIAATPWREPERMWEQSPLKYADRVKTPTLFIHSDMDYRCWMAEALQMFTALKIRGVPARLCLFHGENHELSRSGKPSHRIRRLKEITQWMDTYLR